MRKPVNREIFWVVFWLRPCRRLQGLSPLGDSATSHRRTPTARLVKHVLGRSTLWDLAKRVGDGGLWTLPLGAMQEVQ